MSHCYTLSQETSTKVITSTCFIFLHNTWTSQFYEIYKMSLKAMNCPSNCQWNILFFQFFNEHCALFLVSILPSSFETWLWSALPRLSAPYCHCASMLWETCQPCLAQDPGYVESVWWDSQRPGKHHTSWLKGSMHIHSAIISVTFEQFCLQYAKFHKNRL